MKSRSELETKAESSNLYDKQNDKPQQESYINIIMQAILKHASWQRLKQKREMKRKLLQL